MNRATENLIACPVCDQPHAERFACVNDCWYWRCSSCEATFMDPAARLAPDAELQQYLLHRNDPRDEGHRRYLSAVVEPLLQRLPPASRGLDYGCGPASTTAAMLREAGHDVALYDPFFESAPAVLDQQYDFIVCTEVVEHFHAPLEEFRRLNGLLRSGGLLALMTRFLVDDTDFARWHYRRDPTHVVFYRPATLCRLAAQFDWDCDIPRVDVAFLMKR
jgi:SAM-dependent methyltransferase